ncbi:MAG: hypothetical protein KKB89_03405 [Candidatus Omnitrophica bacterium]|nr:hypothetical protein [Candidatus Omnitrophota bacterium]MBU2504826.1 hypothetical protein [Candidatus Omnitrophota bacterium]
MLIFKRLSFFIFHFSFLFFIFHLTGYPQDPKTPASKCASCEAKKIKAKKEVQEIKEGKHEVILITDKECPFCSIEAPKKFLKDTFAGIDFKILHYQDKTAEEIIKKHGIESLPLFILPSRIKEEKEFPKIANFLEEKEGNLFLKKELSGVFFFLNRREIPQKIDFFLDFYERGTEKIFKDLLDFSKSNKITLSAHFIISRKFKGQHPEAEINIALATRKLYPRKFFTYLEERLTDINITGISWPESAAEAGINYKKIKKFVKSKMTEQLFAENQEFLKELEISEGNVILINNNRLFRAFAVNKEELKEFFNTILSPTQ